VDLCVVDRAGVPELCPQTLSLILETGNIGPRGHKLPFSPL